MGRYLLRRLILMIPTLIGASIVVFIGLRIVPGDPVQMMVGDNVAPGDIERLRGELVRRGADGRTGARTPCTPSPSTCTSSPWRRKSSSAASSAIRSPTC